MRRAQGWRLPVELVLVGLQWWVASDDVPKRADHTDSTHGKLRGGNESVEMRHAVRGADVESLSFKRSAMLAT
jgi:hypothetical protein